MKAIRTILYLAAIGAVFAGGYGYARWKAAHEPSRTGRRILYYVDPMHPAYKSDKPGVAPDCGMRLQPVYESGPSMDGQKIARYRDPLNPSYTSDKPGLNPETGNDLEPVDANGEWAVPAGMIQISPEKQQLIGVTYGQAELSPASGELRAVGKVAPDETRIVRVHSRVDGWIENVYVDFTGALVKKGDPLLTIYSPEMLATQQELLLALKAREIMKSSTLQQAADDSESLVKAARMRLELWDLNRAQIEEVERSGKPIRSITLYSPASGFVAARNAFPKQRITAETELYMLTDLSQVWIMADVFEAELGRIRVGQAATVLLPYENNRSFGARVSYIQPQVDAATRTLKVRLEAANAGMRLKPDMFVDVAFKIGGPAKLTVPSEAVLNAGLRKTVFVDRGRGLLEPRLVETGDLIGDRVEIRSGLKAGERIVTSANFLIDSESQLKSAVSSPSSHEGHQGHGGHP